MIQIKLGGSIITNKKRPLTSRPKTIEQLARHLRRIEEPMVIVHGGGSFGHYWSVKYDMHTKPAPYNLRGVSIVKNSMIALDKMILDSLLENRLKPYSLPPTDFVKGDKPIPTKIREIANIAKSGLTPVTYGDALWYGQNMSYILSGDKIMGMLAKFLRPRLCIFVVDVDGLYSDMKSKNLIRELRKESFSASAGSMDVTGGMTRKVEEASKISRMGTDVFFVNGNKPQRIVDAVKKKKFEGTLIRGRR